MDKIFTEEDWDEIMRDNPELKKEYDSWMLFIKLSPMLAKDVDEKIKELINNERF